MIRIDEGRTIKASRSRQGAKFPPSKPKRKHQWAFKAGCGLLGIALASGGVGALLAQQVSSVHSQLEFALEMVPQLRSELGSGNHHAAQRTFEMIQDETAAARSTTTGPLWKSASYIPVIGANFSAVREVAVSADDVVDRAVAPLMRTYDSFDWTAVSPVDGRIDATSLKDAAPIISSAADTVRISYERLDSIDVSQLLPQLADPVNFATAQLEQLAGALGTASASAKLLPAMLGTEGQRNYLVLVQNSAEVRATGGIPGALAILQTNNGQITLGEQTSASALGAFVPSLGADPEQEMLYTTRIGTQMQNVNLTPHFPTAAATAKHMWEQRHSGQTVDGVISIDPFVLAHLLEATGPVGLTDPQILNLIKGTALPSSLTNENVVSTLLSDVYREIEDPASQDVYFAAVAGQVFAAFADGQGDDDQLLRALTAGAEEGRILLWSSRTAEQEIVESTILAGSVIGPETGGAAFGVYFNDGTGAKMDFYAVRTVQLLQGCSAGGYNNYTARLTVENNAPSDAASSLPPYVTGGGVFGVAPGNIRTNHVFYGPAQSFVETATVNGESVPLGAGRHGQRPVGTVTLELAPGETAVLDVAFSRVVQDSEPRLLVTPTLASPEDAILPLIRETVCG